MPNYLHTRAASLNQKLRDKLGVVGFQRREPGEAYDRYEVVSTDEVSFVSCSWCRLNVDACERLRCPPEPSSRIYGTW